MRLVLNHHRRLLNSSQSQPSPAAPQGDRHSSGSASSMRIMVSILVVVVFCSLAYCVYCWRWRRRNAIRKIQLENSRTVASSDLPLMDLSVIQEATNYFSMDNKLGEGGFGPVYRGVLYGGQEVAVKRLSSRSKQGTEEFRNEVELIAKLQHRNLVRLMGCCVEKEEKILIYEYLPNKSLASFLFDPSKRAEQLNWRLRHNIILGIARGLLYLHEDSLLKVIHRDLKASNVLLDDKLNPKISDFGLAMIHKEDDNEVKTGKVVGTYGYLAPEYAMEGNYSIKSDVFSFGVLLLEILSGRRNGGSHIEQHGQTLLRHAWELWRTESAMEFMDPLLGDDYPTDEAWRCLHVGLLCVQESPDDRPTMSTVVLMLKSEQMPLPPLSEPSSFTRFKVSGTSRSLSSKLSPANKTNSVNDVTLTVVEPR